MQIYNSSTLESRKNDPTPSAKTWSNVQETRYAVERVTQSPFRLIFPQTPVQFQYTGTDTDTLIMKELNYPTVIRRET
jgi:hypothetical protein